MTEACFQMKGSVVTTIVLELSHYSAPLFARQLKEKVTQAPMLFQKSPVVISLEKLSADQADIDFVKLVDICTNAGLQPMAFKGGDESIAAAVSKTGLALLPAASVRASAGGKPPTPSHPMEPDLSQAVTSSKTKERPVRPTKVVSHPVRSGQQIYAQGADLIVMSQVSVGAEVLADGHIHIYGALRGRALAGVQGNRDARIFCRGMEAELLSINGDFILSEDLRARNEIWKQAAQVYHDNNSLRVEAL